jgi:hypothetical protein
MERKQCKAMRDKALKCLTLSISHIYGIIKLFFLMGQASNISSPSQMTLSVIQNGIQQNERT